MVVLGICRCDVSSVPKKFLWESSLLEEVPVGPPLCTNGSQKYPMHYSVNESVK